MVAPLASDFRDLSRINRLTGIPIWAFHSAHDDKTSPRSVRQLVAAIEEAGGDVHLTEIKKSLHDCWIEAFQEYRLLDWLLTQRRNSSQGLSPGHVRWSAVDWARFFGLTAGPAAVVVLIALAVRAEMRRTKMQACPKYEAACEK